MNKNILIWGGVVILALLGIWYFASSGTATDTEDGTATTTVSTNTNTGKTPVTNVKPGVSNTFKSIFTQTGNYQCSYEQVSPSGRSSSVIYLADGKMRGEFRTVSGNENTASLMIYSGGILYSWKEGATVGKKSSIKSLAELPEAIPNDLTSGAAFGVSLNNVSWDCHSWAKDPKMLVVPTYVKF